MALLTGSRPALAQPSNESGAREAFLLGRKAFDDGRFEDALAQFRASYALSARPELLLPLAQTYRKLGRFDDAMAACQRFLDSHPDSDREHSTYEFMGQLRAEKAQAAARPAEPAPPLVAPAPSPSPSVVAAPPPREPPPRRHRLALALGIGAAVVVVGVGLGVGLGLGLGGGDHFPAAGLGTVSFAH